MRVKLTDERGFKKEAQSLRSDISRQYELKISVDVARDLLCLGLGFRNYHEYTKIEDQSLYLELHALNVYQLRQVQCQVINAINSQYPGFRYPGLRSITSKLNPERSIFAGMAPLSPEDYLMICPPIGVDNEDQPIMNESRDINAALLDLSLASQLGDVHCSHAWSKAHQKTRTILSEKISSRANFIESNKLSDCEKFSLLYKQHKYVRTYLLALFDWACELELINDLSEFQYLKQIDRALYFAFENYADNVAVAESLAVVIAFHQEKNHLFIDPIVSAREDMIVALSRSAQNSTNHLLPERQPDRHFYAGKLNADNSQLRLGKLKTGFKKALTLPTDSFGEGVVIWGGVGSGSSFVARDFIMPSIADGSGGLIVGDALDAAHLYASLCMFGRGGDLIVVNPEYQPTHYQTVDGQCCEVGDDQFNNDPFHDLRLNFLEYWSVTKLIMAVRTVVLASESLLIADRLTDFLAKALPVIFIHKGRPNTIESLIALLQFPEISIIANASQNRDLMKWLQEKYQTNGDADKANSNQEHAAMILSANAALRKLETIYSTKRPSVNLDAIIRNNKILYVVSTNIERRPYNASADQEERFFSEIVLLTQYAEKVKQLKNNSPKKNVPFLLIDVMLGMPLNIISDTFKSLQHLARMVLRVTANGTDDNESSILQLLLNNKHHFIMRNEEPEHILALYRKLVSDDPDGYVTERFNREMTVGAAIYITKNERPKYLDFKVVIPSAVEYFKLSKFIKVNSIG